LEIFTRLADRLGLSGYNDKTDEEWLEAFVAATPDLPNYAAFKKKGYHELSVERPWIAFREQIENPADHPFPTPSGKIEIYSQRLADRNDPLMPPIPQYIPPWEGPTDPGVRRFPLQLVNPHSKARVNGQFDNIPKLKAISDDFLWMHPEDARQRAISNGDRVMVFNDRGSLLTGVRVTDRIMKGVVSLDQGTWLDPDEDGVDRGGCVNVLTLDKTSPAEALACNSCLVEVERSAD
jgi:anaerobic dimethyl sulfoxide reductase subunit A